MAKPVTELFSNLKIDFFDQPMQYAIVIIIVSLHIIIPKVNAQDNYFNWFPSESEFPLIEYDLLETQVYTGAFYLNAEKVDYQGVFIPVNIGLRKPFLQWKMLNAHCQIAIGAASYTQFEIIKYDKNTLRGGLLNNDYKASGYFYLTKGRHKFRMQVFHISSHLGDDYMLRNEHYELNDKTVNYEQLDITYLYKSKGTSYYIGLGAVVTPNTYRERFMAGGGIQSSRIVNQNLDLAFGADLKFYHENKFIPDIHSGIGVVIKKKERHQAKLMFDSFYGHMPFSTLKLGIVYWFGISAVIFI
ncbi:MAG: DUF1207 domain-containing protein [Salinivirgaceae bacterium]|jgi:hypothetical protein|nr:DUF1207 domain-containing protein [Salinivirgaceae bacterium]